MKKWYTLARDINKKKKQNTWGVKQGLLVIKSYMKA